MQSVAPAAESSHTQLRLVYAHSLDKVEGTADLSAVMQSAAAAGSFEAT